MTRRMLIRMALAAFALALFPGCDRTGGKSGGKSAPTWVV